MRLALLSDIHGNHVALDAVLDDVTRCGPVDAVVNLGDSYYGPLWPRETRQRLDALGAWTIRGNQDRELIDPPAAAWNANATLRYDVEQLGADAIDALRTLPAAAWLSDEVYACHGTPDSDTEYLLDDVAGGEPRQRSPAAIAAQLAGINAMLIICGHSHIPRAVPLDDGRLIVNPGSVGLPAYDDRLPLPHRMQNGTPQARWALVERDVASSCWQAQLRAVDYDHERAASQAMSQQRPDWAAWLRSGRAG